MEARLAILAASNLRLIQKGANTALYDKMLQENDFPKRRSLMREYEST
jgi:hypothetical protein